MLAAARLELTSGTPVCTAGRGVGAASVRNVAQGHADIPIEMSPLLPSVAWLLLPEDTTARAMGGASSPACARSSWPVGSAQTVQPMPALPGGLQPIPALCGSLLLRCGFAFLNFRRSRFVMTQPMNHQKSKIARCFLYLCAARDQQSILNHRRAWQHDSSASQWRLNAMSSRRPRHSC